MIDQLEQRRHRHRQVPRHHLDCHPPPGRDPSTGMHRVAELVGNRLLVDPD
jgi:hypothetical protein